MAYDKDFFSRAFEGHDDIPADLREASERICSAYGIRGICDPMWVVNVIAKETGRGDGCSKFYA